MHKHPHYPFILLSGFVLSLHAAYINSVSLLGPFQQVVSHISGVVTQLGISLSQFNWERLNFCLLLLLAFLSGSTLGGMLIGSSRFKLGRRYGIALMIQSVLLMLAQNNLALNAYFLTMACGLQNALVTSYSGAVVRTTHMTGVITDLGVTIGHFFREGNAELWKIDLYLILLAGFVSGGVLGCLAFSQWAMQSLWIAAIASGLMGFGYFVFRIWNTLSVLS